MIKPDLLAGAFLVTCDMQSYPDKVVTVFHHLKEGRTLVDGCEAVGCFTADFNFLDVGKAYDRVHNVIKLATKCEQYVKFECRGVMISDGFVVAGVDGKKINYMNTSAEGCQCLLTDACTVHNRTA